jgi:HEAT repeat protein
MKPIGLCILLLVACLVGCAEGPFWRMGKLSPWAREKWAAEEAIADTTFKTKREMNELVATALKGSANEREQAARELSGKALQNPILLTRLQAIRVLGQLDCETTHETLATLSRDPNTDVRLAVIQSWEKMPATVAVPALQGLIANDTNVDVRLAATRALGEYPGEQSLRALNLALTDRDPAIQLRATESLEKVSGRELGRNVKQWQEYVAQTIGDTPAAQTAGETPEQKRR